MSVVGYVPYPLNDSSFLIQPTLPELQRLAEVMGSLSTDAPAGVAAMIEIAEQLPTNTSANAALMIEEAAQLAPREAERGVVDSDSCAEVYASAGASVAACSAAAFFSAAFFNI